MVTQIYGIYWNDEGKQAYVYSLLIKGAFENIQGDDVIVKGVYHRRVCFYKSKHIYLAFLIDYNVHIMMHKIPSRSDVFYYAVKIS